jgi:hypothetical protein
MPIQILRRGLSAFPKGCPHKGWTLAKAHPAARLDQGRERRGLARVPVVAQDRALALAIPPAKAHPALATVVLAAAATALVVTRPEAASSRAVPIRAAPSEMRRDSPLAAAFP